MNLISDCVLEYFQSVKNVATVSSYFFFTSMNAADKLCKASARGDLPEVLLLLQNGADVNGFNRYNRTALQVGMKCF